MRYILHCIVSYGCFTSWNKKVMQRWLRNSYICIKAPIKVECALTMYAKTAYFTLTSWFKHILLRHSATDHMNEEKKCCCHSFFLFKFFKKCSKIRFTSTTMSKIKSSREYYDITLLIIRFLCVLIAVLCKY